MSESRSLDGVSFLRRLSILAATRLWPQARLPRAESGGMREQFGGLVAQADGARDSADWPRAAAAYRSALELQPQDFAIWVQAGHAEKESGRFDDALSCYETAAAIEPVDADLQLQIGHLFNRMDRLDDAVRHYRKALAIDGAFEPAQRSLAETERRLASPEFLLLERADAARDAGDWKAAAPLYRLYLEKQPSHFAIWVQAGHAEKETGDFQQALVCYRRALALNERDSDLHVQLGHLLKLMQDRVGAAAHYRRALDLNRERADAAREVHDLGADAPRPSVREKNISVTPDPAPYRIAARDLATDERIAAMAKEAQESGDQLKAAALERYGAIVSPMDAERWSGLGQALMRLGREADAARCLKIAASIRTRSPTGTP